jgi:hypothetical protein
VEDAVISFTLPRTVEEAKAQLFIAKELAQALYIPGSDFMHSLEPEQRQAAYLYKASCAYRDGLVKMLVEHFKDPEAIAEAEAEKERKRAWSKAQSVSLARLYALQEGGTP